MRKLTQELPDIKEASFHWTIPDLHVYCPDQILKPARGLFLHIKFRETSLERDVELSETVGQKVGEEAFYESFAGYLADELEECTKAVPLGGNCFRDKWGTPDVIGVLSPRPSDILKFPTEIISAEIKTNANALITAFGQACSYRLFSHKVYLVIPESVSEADLARLDALSRVFGLGLILFNAENHQEPDYQIRVRATKHEPDMFYANKNIRVVEDELFT
jgi:hypothetical protein